jgi:transcriptional regulator with XRE-family HTH domain
LDYSTILQLAIKEADLSLSQISRRLKKNGVNADKSYLSKLQTGKMAPASDKMNEALAEVLSIDLLELKAAAYREKIPEDVLEKLKETTA